MGNTNLYSTDAVTFLWLLSWYSQIELQRRVSAQVIFTPNQQVRYSWACVADFRHPLNNIKLHKLPVKPQAGKIYKSSFFVISTT